MQLCSHSDISVLYIVPAALAFNLGLSRLCALVTGCLSISAWYLEYFESDLWNNNAKVISPNIYKIERTLCSLRGVA